MTKSVIPIHINPLHKSLDANYIMNIIKIMQILSDYPITNNVEIHNLYLKRKTANFGITGLYNNDANSALCMQTQ